ncbi:MAG: energy transducer TonB [Cyanobacteria bacterium REEB67]|nr:energy transducer TonB [Cyanobacteria bacterium REEB67]
MPISVDKFRPQAEPNFYSMTSLKDAIFPGFGQYRGGEKRKGLLFILAHSINFLLLLMVIFVSTILKSLNAFCTAYNLHLNQPLSQSFSELGSGSPTALIICILFLAFAIFAAHDAFEHRLKLRRQAIYHDECMAMPEAVSSSYIFHTTFLLSVLFLAFFFLVPLPPARQITDIEFVQTEQTSKEKVETNKRSMHNSRATGKRDPNKPLDTARPQAQAARSQAAKAQPPEAEAAKSQAAKSESVKSELAKSPVPPPVPVPYAIQPPASHPHPQPQPQPQSQSRPQPQPTKLAVLPAAPRLNPSLPAPQAAKLPLPPKIAMALSAAPLFQKIDPSALTAAQPRPTAATAAANSGPALPAPVAVSGGGSTIGTKSGAANLSTNQANNISLAPVGVGRPTAGGAEKGAAPGPRRHPGAATGEADGPGGALSGLPMARPNLGADHPGSGSPSSGTPGSASNSSSSSSSSNQSVGSAHDSGSGQNHNQNTAREGSDLDSTCKQPDWTAYMADLQRRIKRAWFPPHDSESKRVKVVFAVQKNGEMSNLRLIKSSGIQSVDMAALKAVENSAPFRHLPDQAPASVDIEFTFDYNVFNGSLR